MSQQELQQLEKELIELGILRDCSEAYAKPKQS